MIEGDQGNPDPRTKNVCVEDLTFGKGYVDIFRKNKGTEAKVKVVKSLPSQRQYGFAFGC